MTDPAPPPAPETLNLRDVYDLVEQLRAATRTLVCSTDEGRVVEAALAGAPLIRVVTSDWVLPGTAYVVGPLPATIDFERGELTVQVSDEVPTPVVKITGA